MHVRSTRSIEGDDTHHGQRLGLHARDHELVRLGEARAIRVPLEGLARARVVVIAGVTLAVVAVAAHLAGVAHVCGEVSVGEVLGQKMYTEIQQPA